MHFYFPLSESFLAAVCSRGAGRLIAPGQERLCKLRGERMCKDSFISFISISRAKLGERPGPQWSVWEGPGPQAECSPGERMGVEIGQSRLPAPEDCGREGGASGWRVKGSEAAFLIVIPGPKVGREGRMLDP